MPGSVDNTVIGMAQMVNIDAWSRRVRAVTGLDEMHQAVQAFERNVFWAVQNEDRLKQTSRTRVWQQHAMSAPVLLAESRDRRSSKCRQLDSPCLVATVSVALLSFGART